MDIGSVVARDAAIAAASPISNEPGLSGGLSALRANEPDGGDDKVEPESMEDTLSRFSPFFPVGITFANSLFSSGLEEVVG